MISRRKKVRYFLNRIPKSHRVLEIGCADGWVGEYLRANGWMNYTGIDLKPPADIVGDIRNWRELGLAPESFDVIVAFEVLEHVDCLQDCHELLCSSGVLMVSTPVPHMDWLLRVLEWVRLSQPRTTPHRCIRLADLPLFDKDIRIVAGLAQWGLLTKGESRAERRTAGEEAEPGREYSA
jgi:SAM-dependent methyltransferase